MKRRNKKRTYLNSEETLLVISRYAHDSLFDSQKALKKLAKKQQIVVLAEQAGRQKRHVEEKNLVIERVWERDKPLSLLKLIPFITKHDKITHILFQFHFKIFGKKLETNLLVPLLLFWLKLNKKRVYFEFHQIIDEKKIRKNTPWKQKIQRDVFNFILNFFYNSIAKRANSIIVFKPSIQQALLKFIPDKQIILLPTTLVRMDHMRSSKQERNLAKTINFYRRIVSTPYDIAPNVSLNLK